MLFRTEGIVIKTFEYSEADLIVTFFTLDRGKSKGIAKGCRKTKSRFGSSLEPFTHSKISLYGRENTSLPKITQSDILNSHRKVREDLSRLVYGAHMAELIYEVCPEGETNKEVFYLLSFILSAIESNIDLEFFSIFFDIRFLRLMGYQPRLNKCVRCSREDGVLKFYPKHGGLLCKSCSNPEDGYLELSPETKELYYRILSLPLHNISHSNLRYSLTSQIRDELKAILSFHLNYILGKRLKTSSLLTWQSLNLGEWMWK